MKKDNLRVLFMDDINAYIDLYKSDIIEFLNNNDMDLTPCNIEDGASELISADYEYFMDSVLHFDLSNYDYILIDIKLGLWSGERVFKAKTKTLKEAITKALQDINIIYIKNNSTLQLSASHHDGENNFKFYKVIHGKKYAIKYNDIFNF